MPTALQPQLSPSRHRRNCRGRRRRAPGRIHCLYDPLNNLRQRTGTSPLSYAYNAANQLELVSGAVGRSYLYNPEGQATSDGTGKTFTWNGADRITAISGVGAYAYDGWGKRIKTTKASGAVEYTVYSKAGTMLYSYKPANGESTDYVYLGNIPLAQVRTVPDPQEPAPQPLVPDLTQNPALTEIVQLSDGLPPQVLGLRDSALRTVSSNQDPPPQTATTTVTYLHADLLSSPIQWSGSTGSLLSQEHYEPYGHKMNGVADKLGYTGHVFDADSGLTYMQARFYDPQVGRMLSTDPQNFDGASPFTFNRYAYGNNNPYRYTDPNGEIALQVVAGLVGGAVGFTTNVVAQAATKGGMGNVNFYEATAAGAATAAVSVAVTLSPALVANPSALSALSGAVNATASAAADLAQGKSVNGTQAAASAVGGMLGAPTGAAVARALGNEVVGEIGGAIAGEAAAAGLTIGVPAVTDAAAAGLSNAADSVNKGLKSAGEGLRETFEPRKTPD